MKEEKQQLLIILLIVFVGFVGTSIAYPLFPPLFLHPEQQGIIPASWSESTRSILLGIALAAYPLGQFIGSPLIGGCSDSYGRKHLLIVSLSGSALGYLLSALALQYNWLWILIASRFFTGLMEGNFAIVRAMAADLSSIDKFTSIGRINAVAGIGYVMGPILGGFLSDAQLVPWFSFTLPFFLAVLLSILSMILAAAKLSEKKIERLHPVIPIWDRFKLITRFKKLFKSSERLKYLLIISTIFTFSVDIFYEFGPVYLTGLWSMTPSGIAVYNAALSITLAIGAGVLPHYLSLYFSVERVVAVMMLITAVLFGCMVILPTPLLALFWFGLVGLSIATINTNITILVSNEAHDLIQGEALGAQIGLRMLGDAVICLAGGFVIALSVMIPLAASCLIAFIAMIMYVRRFVSR